MKDCAELATTKTQRSSMPLKRGRQLLKKMEDYARPSDPIAEQTAYQNAYVMHCGTLCGWTAVESTKVKEAFVTRAGGSKTSMKLGIKDAD
ncbi:hypothetical protein AALO_G00063590 [Alosa alosa]|uniref:Uncharacterized protein n=1 Tax=Alosa alosa TaxID=278164 RepID=A0AAV6H061_9TELE|nr:hypothetical protein AALO_G00063590 [Alosa alosa]